MNRSREHWLEKVREPAIDPDIAICDPHHHLWVYPDNTYLLDEFLKDLCGGHNVVSTIYVECQQFYDRGAVEELQPVGETRFINELSGPRAVSTGTVEVAAGIVGFADLMLAEAVLPILEAHKLASPRFRGVRHASAWHASENIHNAHSNPPPGLLRESRFRKGVACMDNLGLTFDAWLYQDQIEELADLADAFPGLTIVVNHMAGPLGIGPYANRRDEVFDSWRSSMKMLSERANVFVKLGGRTMTSAGFAWHRGECPPDSKTLAKNIGPYVDTCIQLFGPSRCMFESNFPVDRASCSYTVLWNCFKRIGRNYSAADRSELFHDTAHRVYRLSE